MSEIEKASAEAVEAARQGEQFAVILAAVQAAQAQQQQPACTHHQVPAPARPSNAGKWVAAGVGGSVFLVAFALSAVAVAISAVSLTVCLLILRGVWSDMRRERG